MTRANFAEELADTLIRVLDLASGLGIDLDSEVIRKLNKNKQRLPSRW
jgi:NTP pyrophosphatase (non-canonical NTP hydrolase)